MNSERIEILVRLGLIKNSMGDAKFAYDITWHAQLDQDEADEVFSTQVGTLVWAD